jgi:tetratricopeptide (TPR) repeat protein
MNRFSRYLLATLLMGMSTVPVTVAAAENALPVSTDKQLTRDQALRFVDHGAPDKRLAAIERLAEVGTMADAEKLVPRLRDENENVRELAQAAMWHIWSRSGDAEIDTLYQQGIRQMQAANLDDALTTFSEIIRRKPGFAEGWNKRATILYMAGEHRQSLKDCDEVLKRNPNHFGALSGMAQIHIILGHPEHALEAYERAVKINPNLPEAEENLKTLREAVNEKKSKTV